MTMDLSKLKEGDCVPLQLPTGEFLNFRVVGRDSDNAVLVDGSPRFGRFRLDDLLEVEPAAAPPPEKAPQVTTRALEAQPVSPQLDTPPVPTQPPVTAAPPLGLKPV